MLFLQVHGNTSGLSAAQVRELENLYRKRVPFEFLTTPELTRELVRFSHATGRQVGVIADRKGAVHFVIVGDATKLFIPDIGRLRAAQGRLRGLRLIHTHLHNQPLTRDDIVDLTKLRLDMVVAICLCPGEARAMWTYFGHLLPISEDSNEAPYRTEGPLANHELDDINPAEIVLALEAEFSQQKQLRRVEAKDGRAILIHVHLRADGKGGKEHAKVSMRELQELARTAGVEVVSEVIQLRDRMDAKYMIGRGKLDEVVINAMRLDAEVLIFDHELSPAQAAAIARATDMKIIDRTQLILDIFAQRAESRDGKLQVELAQTKYLLPRLGRGQALSRLAGGIGGRGPGETKLEVGRRRANERIDRIRKELKKLEGHRKQRRSNRKRSRVGSAAIIGYTNAGKSTLLNTMSGSDVLAEDKLFATLDTRTRRVHIRDGNEVLVTDTVGFIRELPKDLFAAFRATFEEAAHSEMLIHVIDVSDPDFEKHLAETEKIILELEIEDMPRVLVFNKMDCIDLRVAETRAAKHGGILVSATKRASLAPLMKELELRLVGPRVNARLRKQE